MTSLCSKAVSKAYLKTQSTPQKMNQMSNTLTSRPAEKYAEDFLRLLKLNSEPIAKCEWSCILWSKEYWANQARKMALNLQLAKEKLGLSVSDRQSLEPLFQDSGFMNTISQVYSKLFDGTERSCAVKEFRSCPYAGQREHLLNRGLLANTFVTILQKATMYSMLEHHPLDSGLIHDEYTNAYGIDMTNYEDMEKSLNDGRFQELFGAVVKRATQLAGLLSETTE